MKRPKRVTLKKVYYQSYSFEYQCPHCKTYFKKYGFDECITRFLCGNCGNEIIVDNKWIVADKGNVNET